MRIIVVNDHGSVTGGAAQVAIASLNALANAGHDVTFVSSVPPIHSGINKLKVRIVNFGFSDLLGNPSRLSAAINGVWDFRCAKLFRYLLGEYENSDTIVHFHSWTKSLSSSVINEALRQKFKVVVTLHDYFSVCPNGGLFDYSTQQHCSKKPMSVACAMKNCDSRSYLQKNWRFMRHFLQAKYAGVPSLICNFISISDYSERLLIPHLPSSARLFRVRNPIDVARAPFSDRKSSSKFTFVGRLSPEKGASLFAVASRKANVEAVFVGDGPESMRVCKLNPDAVQLGWQNRDAVISHMLSSRAIVFPSLWHETQGLVVTEAAALGIPSIVSSKCAARNSIVDGETGLVFRAGDEDDLTKKIAMLDSDSDLSTRLGRAAYEKYWTNPSTLDSHVRELISCYREILQSPCIQVE